MAKRTMVKDYDQFQLRLPPGMRERIKAKADRAGMSMNEAIVWCLDQYFPAPQTLSEKLSELVEKVAMLKGDDTNAAVDNLIDELDATLAAITEKTGFAPEQFGSAVAERYSRYLEEEAENLRYKHENPFDAASDRSDPFGEDLVEHIERSLNEETQLPEDPMDALERLVDGGDATTPKEETPGRKRA